MWPSAFYTVPNGAQALDSFVVGLGHRGESQPQTIVYQINPRAVWSDGTPLTYADFVYNWQAQSGKRASSTSAGVPYRPVSTAGYDDIADVRGSPADPYTATVTFSSSLP